MKKEIKKLTIKDLFDQNRNLTVGDLKRFIEENKLSDDAPILVQRVEDVYFGKHGWGVLLQKSDFYYQCVKTNKMIDDGVYNNKDNYPNIDDPEKFRTTEEELESYKDQYIPTFCCVREDDKNDILLINLHY